MAKTINWAKYNKRRDYKEVYKKFHSSDKMILERNARNKIRAIMKKKYGSKLKGKDIHHKDYNVFNMSPNNLKIESHADNMTDRFKHSKKK